jgi:hypothetical protein
MVNKEKTGIILLLVLTILVSIIGTFTVLNAINDYNHPVEKEQPVKKNYHVSTTQGQIIITNEKPVQSSTTGMVILTIEKGE